MAMSSCNLQLLAGLATDPRKRLECRLVLACPALLRAAPPPRGKLLPTPDPHERPPR